jgi:hypothetical protein
MLVVERLLLTMDRDERSTFWGHRVLRGGVLGYLQLLNLQFPSYQNACVDFVSQNKKKALISSLPPICSFSF